LSLRHPEILRIEEMVQKILAECSGFDNLYYEVCNEPIFQRLQALDEWENMTNFIAEAESTLPVNILSPRIFQNGSFKVENPHPAYPC
jgi:hypothetical protein